MATVNIANNGWQIQTQTSNISVTANSASVYFIMGGSDELRCAKACVAINASNYNKITLTYSNAENVTINDVYFGVFDNMSAEYYYNTQYDNGIRPSSLSGIGVTNISPNYNGTITIDIPSDASGTKYVGFLFYGNTWNASARPRRRINMSSLTATERGYALTYNANGGSGAPSSVSGIMSTIISSTIPTRTGYDFLGWSTSSSATSASYFSGNSISLSSNVTLYAVWRKKTYTVTYNASGGSGAPSNQTKTHGTTLTLSNTKPTRASTSAGSYTVTLNANGGTCSYGSLSAARTTSYTFNKWNTNSSGTGTSYSPGGSYTSNEPLYLYAIYNSSTSTESVTLPIPERDGYEFMGWATSSTATYGITGGYTPTKNVTLYAIWKSMGIVYIYDGVEYSPYKVLIYDGSGWNQYMPYIYTESGWEVYSG